MNIILKYKKEILAAIAIIALYFTSRLILLGNFPIFTDEAIYVLWSKIASNDAAWRFISLTDGKQPMLVWAGMLSIKLIDDPLVATRLVSVAAGFFSMIGLWFLTYELFKDKRAAFLSSLLYVCFPFAVVYDRLALYDSSVAAFAIWAIYFSIILVRKIRLDVALILGLILGGGMLTKTSANFSIILIPVTLLLFNFKNKKWKLNLIKWGILVFIAAVMAEVIYNFLRLSPFFHIIKEKNNIFVYYPFSIPISQNIQLFIGNLKGLTDWLFSYLTPFYVVLILAAFINLKKYLKEKIVLVLFFALPFIALALFGKVIFPRFIFFMSCYLIPLASVGMLFIIDYLDNFFKKRKMQNIVISILVVIFFLIYPIKVSLDFIFNPADAAIASADKDQYISEWPAGGGVKESIKYFEEEAKKGPIFIGTEGTFGLMPGALDIYLGDNKNIKTQGYWPVGSEIPKEVLENSKKMPTYFIFYQPCEACEYSGDAPDSWPLKLISKFKKSDNVYYSIYKVQQ